jgi:hypothetical protein
VLVTDKLPLEIARSVWRGPYGLDDQIYSMVRGDHSTEAAALAALSDACLLLARSQKT